ncbi:MAG: hypothetical protein HC865_03845 [Cyanobacteria bacterium RU_5_0]|nr:hypothetical protein [Cyanobacteria bacterium RU_5_0]
MIKLQKWLKNVPISVRCLIRPALLLSLGVHALMLALPIAPDPASPDPEASMADPDVAIDLTSLPPELLPSPQLASSPTPPASISQSPSSNPQLAPSPGINVQPLPSNASVAIVETAPPQASPEISSSPNSPPPDGASASQSPLPSNPPPAPTTVLAAPFADLPQLTGSQSGCLGLGGCRQIAENPGEVSQTLKQQMEAQGYTVRLRDDLIDTSDYQGMKIYEVSKDGTTRYLNVISSGLGETIYILTPELTTRAEIENAGTVQTELETVLTNLSGGNRASYPQFVYPDLFFTGTNPRPEIGGQFHLIPGGNPTQLSVSLTSTLQGSGFAVSPVGEYGGGIVYEISQRAFMGYLNLIPTQDGMGTIVVVWRSLPG